MLKTVSADKLNSDTLIAGLLSCLAGYTDALTFLLFDRSFASLMSGNVLMFAYDFYEQSVLNVMDWLKVYAIAVYLLGSGCGALIQYKLNEQKFCEHSSRLFCLKLKAISMTLFALGCVYLKLYNPNGSGLVLMCCVATFAYFSMGFQFNIQFKINEVSYRTTVMSSNLHFLMSDVIMLFFLRFRGASSVDKQPVRQRIFINAIVLVLFQVGLVCGALVAYYHGFVAGIVPAVLFYFVLYLARSTAKINECKTL